MTVLSSLS